MRGPVGEFTVVDALHGDALVDRTDMHAQVATHALFVDHFEMPLAILRREDGLMCGVLAGDVAEPALDAQVLVDAAP
jgi:hypothetical protein